MTIDNLTFLSGAEMTDKSLFIVCQDSNLDIKELPHCLFRLRSANGNWEKKDMDLGFLQVFQELLQKMV